MERFMKAALAAARESLAEGGVPVGTVLVHRGVILGTGHNQRVQLGSSVLHGVLDALENAGRQSPATYRESTLYTTLAPCAMCSGAILLYHIPRVVIGENRSLQGEQALLRERGVAVEVLQDPECLALMHDFIAGSPDLWHEDIGD